jgi:hypothetical protein
MDPPHPRCRLISVSADDLFENPAQHGRGGPAYLLAGGGRWFVSRQVALGVELALTKWTRVSRPEVWSGGGGPKLQHNPT